MKLFKEKLATRRNVLSLELCLGLQCEPGDLGKTKSFHNTQAQKICFVDRKRLDLELRKKSMPIRKAFFLEL